MKKGNNAFVVMFLSKKKCICSNVIITHFSIRKINSMSAYDDTSSPKKL